MPALTVESSLPRSVDAAAIARRHLERRFAGAVSAHTLEDAKVVATELIANAVEHGEGEVTFRGALDAGRLRLEVVDEGGGGARAIPEEPEDEPGAWGLRIVEALSLRWGAFEGSTHVWAELDAS